MIAVDAIRARLDAQVAGLRKVEVSLDVAAMVEGAVGHPTAYVVPTGRRGGKSPTVTGMDQVMTESLIVLIGVPARNDKGAGGAVDDLRGMIGEICAALSGWRPEGAIGAMRYTGDRLASVPRGAVWWAVTFTVETY